MSNPTSNFGWQMPTNSDLVTDLPADFEVFGQAVDTSLADLKGGTSGQVLSKNSNTDMDFTWIDNQVGDITAITATSPLTGGGTSGDVTVGIQDGSTTQKGAVQLTDSTASTSTTTAATPNSVKTAYDLANAAIPKSTVTTSGDIIYATGSSAVTRLGIGSSGQLLSVSGGVPAWTTVSAGAMTQLATGSLSGSSVTISGISGSYRNLWLVVLGFKPSSGGDALNGRVNSDSSTIYTNRADANSSDYTVSNNSWNNLSLGASSGSDSQYNVCTFTFIEYANTSQYKFVTKDCWTRNTTASGWNYSGGFAQANTISAISSINLFPATGTFTGTYYLYGVK